MVDDRFETKEPATFVVAISQGQSVQVVVADSDGTFTISYGANGEDRLLVHADMPDDGLREGLIYEHDYSIPAGNLEVEADGTR